MGSITYELPTDSTYRILIYDQCIPTNQLMHKYWNQFNNAGGYTYLLAEFHYTSVSGPD